MRTSRKAQDTLSTVAISVRGVSHQSLMEHNAIFTSGFTVQFFRGCSQKQAMEELSGRPDAEELADFFAQVNAAYFAGRLDTLDRDAALWQAWSEQGGFLSAYLQSIREDPAGDSTTYDGAR